MTCCIMESSATTVTLLSRRLNVRVLTLVNPFFTKITWRKWKFTEFSLFADDKHFTFFAKARNITETSRTALYEPCVRGSVFMRYSEIIQVFLEYIMCRQAGVGQLAFFPVPFLQSAVIKHFMLSSIINGTFLHLEYGILCASVRSVAVASVWKLRLVDWCQHLRYCLLDNALYTVPVRQTEALLWASFRLRLTTDALALCLQFLLPCLYLKLLICHADTEQYFAIFPLVSVSLHIFCHSDRHYSFDLFVFCIERCQYTIDVFCRIAYLGSPCISVKSTHNIAPPFFCCGTANEIRMLKTPDDKNDKNQKIRCFRKWIPTF